MQAVAFHKDVCLPQFHANGTDRLFQDCHFRSDPRTDREGKRLPFLLPPPPPVPRLPSVPTVEAQTPDGDLKSPLIAETTCYLPSDLHNKVTYKGGAGRIFKRPAQRKPAKGNGAPQSAYPVSAAFNRMSLMHRFLYLLTGEQEQGCSRGKSLEMFTVL